MNQRPKDSPASGDARGTNAAIWEGLYDRGLVINYPNDVFVRLTHRLLKLESHPKVLDYGFGSGQNAAHLLKKGFDVHGVEVSVTAAKNAEKLFPPGNLKLLNSAALPYPDNSFDAVIAWSVLEYNDWDGFRRAVREIDRVLRGDGIFLAAINAPGDVKQRKSVHLENGLYRLNDETGQGNAKVLIPEKEQLAGCFPGRDLTIGHYELMFDAVHNKHWIVSYRKPQRNP